MRGLKAFGERIAARDTDLQTAEIYIRIALINCFSALGTAEIICVALGLRGKGASRRRPELRNMATIMQNHYISKRTDCFWAD